MHTHACVQCGRAHPPCKANIHLQNDASKCKVQRQAHIYHEPPSQLLTYEWAPAQIHHLKPKHAHNHLFTQLHILWIWMNNSSEVWTKINLQKHTGIHTFIQITAVSIQTQTPIHLHKCDLLPVARVWPNRPPRCCLSSGSPCVEAACFFFWFQDTN